MRNQKNIITDSIGISPSIPLSLNSLAYCPEELVVYSPASHQSYLPPFPSLIECSCNRFYNRKITDFGDKNSMVYIPKGFKNPLDFFESVSTQYLAQTFSAKETSEITIASLGSGYLLREVIFIAKLLKKLEKIAPHAKKPKINLDAIDSDYKENLQSRNWLKSTPYLCQQQFRSLMEILNLDVTLRTYVSVDDYNKKIKDNVISPPQVILSIDFNNFFDIDFQPKHFDALEKKDTQEGILYDTKQLAQEDALYLTLTEIERNQGIFIILQKKHKDQWRNEWVHTVFGADKKRDLMPPPEIQRIIANGAEPFILVNDDPNALYHWPAFTQRTGEHLSRFPLLHLIAGEEDAAAKAEILLAHGADITRVDPHTGNTVLHAAIALNNTRYKNYLIETIAASEDPRVRALLNQADTHPNWGNSPVIFEAKLGHRESVKLFILKGINVHQSDRFRSSLLHLAALGRYNDVILELLARGAKPDQYNRFARLPIDLYLYELKPLDFERRLKAINSNIGKSWQPVWQKSARVTFETNLPEISDVKFHGFHRSEDAIDPEIVRLLEAPRASKLLSLEDCYLRNFKEQEIIASEALYVEGSEYIETILPTLKSEKQRIYPNEPLPNYAISNTQYLSMSPAQRKKYENQKSKPIVREEPKTCLSTGEVSSLLNFYSLFLKINDNPSVESKNVLKNEDSEDKEKDAKRSALLPPVKTADALESYEKANHVPAGLQKILQDSLLLREYSNQGKITLTQLIDLYQQTPWVIGGLRFSNISQAIHKNLITIAQLSQLTQAQIEEIKRLYDDTLKSAVEKYLKQNQTVTSKLSCT